MAVHPKLVAITLSVGLTFGVAVAYSIIVGGPLIAFAKLPTADNLTGGCSHELFLYRYI